MQTKKPQEKIAYLDTLIRKLAAKEISDETYNISNIYQTINNWENDNSLFSKKDIKEALENSEYAQINNPLKAFIIGSLLDETIYRHDILSGDKDNYKTAAICIDVGIQENDPTYITRKADARKYLRLLGFENIKDFLKENGYKSVEDFNNRKTNNLPKAGGRK